MKPSFLWLSLVAFSGAICAEQTDTCAGLEGTALSQCRTNQQTLQQTLRLQERLEQQLHEQQERQTQLDKQQREVQQQLESMRLQNESLRNELEREAADQRARPVASSSTDPSKSAELKSAEHKSADLKSWKADNPWFGSDYSKTQFAMRYIKQLQKERPDLAGRELLDAVSTKVNGTFAASH